MTLRGSSAEFITEPQAIEFSREALRRLGEDVTSLVPAACDHKEQRYYSRNSLTPTRGYVLWRSLKGPAGYAFSVSLEQTGGDIHCGVGRCK